MHKLHKLTSSFNFWTSLVYSYFEKGCRKNVHATIPKGNMGYDRYTVPDDCSCRTYFCCFPLALANTFSWPLVPILSHFSEEQGTQNHPQCLSGLSRALFPTTFLEIAVYGCIFYGLTRMLMSKKVNNDVAMNPRISMNTYAICDSPLLSVRYINRFYTIRTLKTTTV